MGNKLKILIVDDSPTMRRMLSNIVNETPDMQVVGEANDGRQGVQLTQELHPSVVLMDLVMPHMDGLEATREIMHAAPTPVVVVSASLDSYETDIAFEAISAGALTVLKKPTGPGQADHYVQVSALLNTIRAMARVRVIHHWRRGTSELTAAPPAAAQVPSANKPPRLVAIVSSTGGPAALVEIASKLPASFAQPIAIVQHIAPDFVPSLAGWLKSVTPLNVAIAQQNEVPQPGTLYIAPGGVHLRLSASRRFELSEQPSTAQHIPSGDVLLESVARSYGPQAIGIVLTGMGSDGARGLKAMRDAGATTIAQDEASCVVYGMPAEAVALGAARYVLPVTSISQVLMQLTAQEVQH